MREMPFFKRVYGWYKDGSHFKKRWKIYPETDLNIGATIVANITGPSVSDYSSDEEGSAILIWENIFRWVSKKDSELEYISKTYNKYI